MCGGGSVIEGLSHRSQHLETSPFLTSIPCHQSANQPLIHLWATWIIPPLFKSWLVKHVLLLNEPGVLATVTNQSMKPINLSGKNQFPSQSIRPIWGQYIRPIYQANLPRHLLGHYTRPLYQANLLGQIMWPIIGQTFQVYLLVRLSWNYTLDPIIQANLLGQFIRQIDHANLPTTTWGWSSFIVGTG